MGSRVDGDFNVAGRITADFMTVPDNAVKDAAIASDAAIQRTKFLLETKTYPINLMDLRVHDAIGTPLPNTSSSDDLGLYGGTFGTDMPAVQTYDVKNAGAQTLRARFLYQLPAEYEAGQNLTLRIRGGMKTTIASTTATVDVEAFLGDRYGAVSGSDLCTTSLITINSLTAADKDFTINGAALSAGKWLDIRLTVAVNDSATVTAVIAKLGSIEMLVPVRG